MTTFACADQALRVTVALKMTTIALTGEPAARAERLPHCPRYESLDIWRGVACLMVIAFHSSLYLAGEREPPWSWISRVLERMWAGVAVFFVISGYCIAATADSERRKRRGTVSYFRRRLRRIFPPYWIALDYHRPNFPCHDRAPVHEPSYRPSCPCATPQGGGHYLPYSGATRTPFRGEAEQDSIAGSILERALGPQRPPH